MAHTVPTQLELDAHPLRSSDAALGIHSARRHAFRSKLKSRKAARLRKMSYEALKVTSDASHEFDGSLTRPHGELPKPGLMTTRLRAALWSKAAVGCPKSSRQRMARRWWYI